MKNPNGFGSVIRLSGKRRKPFAVRITAGYDDEGRQKFKYVGYYGTRKEAIYRLSLYNNNPYDVDIRNLTLQEIYERYAETQKNKVGEGRLKAYRLMHGYLSPLLNMKISELRTAQLQSFFDSLSGRISTGSIRGVRGFLSSLFRYAMKIEAADRNYVRFVDLQKHEKVIERKIFTAEEIALLWTNLGEFAYADVILILIYTGMRINELLKLKKESVDLENMTITGGSKTKAGKNRIIPIHPKILPLVIKRTGNRTDYLIPNRTETNHYIYNNFRKAEFEAIMDSLGMKHTIHDTRHTFATMITEVSSNDAAIKGIIGHSSIGMTRRYTHTDVEKMRKEIEKIN